VLEGIVGFGLGVAVERRCLPCWRSSTFLELAATIRSSQATLPAWPWQRGQVL
jgi:hypothetical protein